MLNLCDLVKDEREEEENEEDLKGLVQAVQRGNIDQVCPLCTVSCSVMIGLKELTYVHTRVQCNDWS